MAALIALLILICSPLIGGLNGRAWAQNFNPRGGRKNGLIQVGFVSAITDTSPSNLANIFLNVIAVRFNPLPKKDSKNQNLPNENNPKWVTIPIPSGAGAGVAGRPGDLQIDLLAGRTQLQMFNTAAVRIQTFRSIELVLDTTNPGYVVPVCSLGGALEGCTTVPLQLTNPGNQISILASSPVTVTKQGVTVVPLQINFTFNGRPTVQGQPYSGTVTISQVAATKFEAKISGTVSGSGSGIQAKHIRRLTLSAEPMGTNNVVASANVIDSAYQIFVPAPAPDSGAGASYDLFISGGGVPYEAVRMTGNSGSTPAVFAGDDLTVNFSPSKVGVATGTISGNVKDQCTSSPVIGATLQLLIPPHGTSGINCADPTSTSQCVSVATANTDNAGNFPLPGTVFAPAPFDSVPVNSSSSAYTMQISAPGYNSVIDGNVFASASKVGGKCPDSKLAPPLCDYELPTSYLSGTITLGAAPAPGTYVMTQVFAENHSTNTLVSALTSPIIILPTNNTGAFTINVPANDSTAPSYDVNGQPNLDLFAQAIDQYAGGTDPYPGHTIITASNIAAPTTFCQTPLPDSNLFPAAETMDCVGHGSITGLLNNPDINTFVELSKNYDQTSTGDVQLLSAVPVSLIAPGGGTTNPPVGNGYSFCVPPDNYSLTRYEGATPVESPSPIGTPTPIAVAPPQPTGSPSPCPSTCEDSNNKACPGICGNTSANPL